MRRCYICKKEKSLSEFYKDKTKSLGFSNRCKICNKIQLLKWRIKNRKHVSEYVRKYNQTEKGKEIKRKNQIRDRMTKPLACKAVHKLNYAIQKGIIIRKPCVICGKKAQAHHSDYTKPYDVIWLCSLHHTRLHHTLPTGER